MTALIIGLVIFLGIHSVSIVKRPWRDGIAARIGDRLWRGLYSLVAILGFALMILGYGQARHASTMLYAPPSWSRDVSLLLMLPVFPLLLAAYLPGRIQRAVKHPMLLAVLIWAVAHLLSNGSLADVLLFGAFLIWAVADLVSAARRAQRPSVHAPPAKRNDAIAVVAGLAVYAVFVLGGHAWLIGVPATNWALF